MGPGQIVPHFETRSFEEVDVILRAIGRPRLAVVGPLVGRNPGHVTTQGEKLAALFQSNGYTVLTVSHHKSRYVRLLDIIGRLLLKRREIDIVLLAVYGGRSFLVEDIASRLSRILNLRIVMTLHGGAMPQFMERFPRWTRRVLARADTCVAQSTYLAEAVRLCGFACRIIPNVIDLGAYPYRLRKVASPKLLWMRSFHPIYRPEMALEVLALVRRTHPSATLVMAGQDKGLEARLRRLAAEMGLQDAVRFPGFLDMGGKTREGHAADVFLNTPRIDNQPIAVVEACAMGLAVVTTDVGGIPYFLQDGETALIVPDGNAKEMARAVLRLLEDRETFERLSRNGRELAGQFAAERVGPQWDTVFDEVLWAGDSERETG